VAVGHHQHEAAGRLPASAAAGSASTARTFAGTRRERISARGSTQVTSNGSGASARPAPGRHVRRRTAGAAAGRPKALGENAAGQLRPAGGSASSRIRAGHPVPARAGRGSSSPPSASRARRSATSSRRRLDNLDDQLARCRRSTGRAPAPARTAALRLRRVLGLASAAWASAIAFHSSAPPPMVPVNAAVGIDDQPRAGLARCRTRVAAIVTIATRHGGRAPSRIARPDRAHDSLAPIAG
jgi:hypothetical protein